MPRASAIANCPAPAACILATSSRLAAVGRCRGLPPRGPRGSIGWPSRSSGKPTSTGVNLFGNNSADPRGTLPPPPAPSCAPPDAPTVRPPAPHLEARPSPDGLILAPLRAPDGPPITAAPQKIAIRCKKSLNERDGGWQGRDPVRFRPPPRRGRGRGSDPPRSTSSHAQQFAPLHRDRKSQAFLILYPALSIFLWMKWRNGLVKHTTPARPHPHIRGDPDRRSKAPHAQKSAGNPVHLMNSPAPSRPKWSENAPNRGVGGGGASSAALALLTGCGS